MALGRKGIIRKETKRNVFTQDLQCGFHTSGYGLQFPIIFHDESVGSHHPFKRHRVPQISLILVDLHLF